MRHFGYRDAEVTGAGADRGIDVVSDTAVAQVKLWSTNKVGRPDVQMLQGAARQKKALFFSSSGYSRPAEEWARSERIALFLFDRSGLVEPVNDHATQIVRASQNLGPPLTERQKLVTDIVGWAIGISLGVVIGSFGLSALLTTPDGCYPGINTSSPACDRPLAGPFILAFVIPVFVVGAAALWIPPALRSLWQDRIDQRWRTSQVSSP
jgi:hypothetical protein